MTEKELIIKFNRHCIKTYKDSDVYHVYSCGYGEQGQPDLLFSYPDDPRTFFIEAKNSKGIAKALTVLRPSQRGRIKKLLVAKRIILLLYDGGCYDFASEKDFPDGNFKGFDNLLAKLYRQQ